MCGILGQVSRDKPVLEAGFCRRLSTLNHRGPDDHGVVLLRDGRVALGHRRLSIIDLSKAGRQPMANEDATVWLTFNGEIYNFSELREALQRVGHIFRSHADSEVILHGYEEWGDECVPRLRGIFAFGVWDDRRERLLLARDQVGVKPLYYVAGGEGIGFASQARALLPENAAERKVNPEAFRDYLAYGYVPFDRAVYDGMRKLPAGHCLAWERGMLQVRRYWQLECESCIASEEEAVPLVRAALRRAVARQCVSDVPVGVFLSGGVDSSLVTALLREVTRDSLQSFTIGFHEPESDERPFARVIADACRTMHHERVLEAEAAQSMFADFADLYDEPFSDSSGIPTLLVSRLAREHGIKVILAGDGGDELFGGYLWYDRIHQLAANRSPSGICSPWWRRLLFSGVSQPHFDRDLAATYLGCIGISSPAWTDSVLGPAARATASYDPLWLMTRFCRTDWPAVLMGRYADIHTYLVDDILTKVDRASMACGVEVRVPLLDLDLVELAFRVRSDVIYGCGDRKRVLKAAAIGVVPTPILSARKKGFGIPKSRWRDVFRADVHALVPGGSLEGRGLLAEEAGRRLNGEDDPTRLWMILAAELWARRWLEGQSVPELRDLLAKQKGH
jgi:asparagine synthase (glutamine-hydrolysing)